ncbi:NAD(P)H-dependent oxidoreductase [Aquimarina sp. 2201CG5-10]|uniref:NAD(P)H-dependent oxidoreductase n=1 Tax=Aquimarina callyspongiae TaxID=3098150 RepID=UPI002AB453B6|nr:NAD(P)H-dependent oxidoreductase [Aquimarina sp. 2201CG5-10]MDY8134337.1 NAD(P)H-dependent oxidoreductase [Aquimarina sp. 2201CG5-10]
MKKVAGISTSSSKKSINKELLKYTLTQIPKIETTILDLGEDIPIYNIDIEETQGIPDYITSLYQELQNYDGFILALPEHNGSMTALLKNTLDWLSRIDRNIFNNKNVFLLSTSPGPSGGQYAVRQVSQVIPFLGAKVAASYSLPGFYNEFDNGISSIEENEKLHTSIQEFVKQL